MHPHGQAPQFGKQQGEQKPTWGYPQCLESRAALHGHSGALQAQREKPQAGHRSWQLCRRVRMLKGLRQSLVMSPLDAEMDSITLVTPVLQSTPRAASNTSHTRARSPGWFGLGGPSTSSPLHPEQPRTPAQTPWQGLGMALGAWAVTLGKDRAQGQSSGEAELHLCRNTQLHFHPPCQPGAAEPPGKVQTTLPRFVLFTFSISIRMIQRLTAQQRFREPLRAGTWS